MQFLKSLLSAQFASIVDFVLTIVLSSFLGVYYVVATTLGAVCGGVVNCMVNYKWVFPCSDVKKRHVAMKYALVWLASIALNAGGTYLLTENLAQSAAVKEAMGSWLPHLYIISKVVVAVIVALCWNYQMYRYFVYRNLHLVDNKIFIRKI